MKENEARKKVRKMIEGLVYHCDEIANFLKENVSDAYFETEEGSQMLKNLMGIMTNHITALTTFMVDDLKESKQKTENVDIEKLLRDFM